MYKTVDAFMESVINKNPGQEEFHQAVEEVVESIWDFLQENPHYQHAKVLDRIVEPVTHVKDVGHVRRRDHDDVRIRATRQRGFGLDVEVPSLSPGTVEGTLDGLWI